jgi:hypothetical protein
MKSRTLKITSYFAGFAFLIALAAGLIAIKRFHHPSAMGRPGRAGEGERPAPRKLVEMFLEARYGSLDNPTNREKAFLDFFNSDNVKRLNLVVNNMPKEFQSVGINGMADWVSSYRTTMTPAEKNSLRAALATPEGAVKIRQATAAYLKQDVYYRAASARVIEELMATLDSIQNP